MGLSSCLAAAAQSLQQQASALAEVVAGFKLPQGRQTALLLGQSVP